MELLGLDISENFEAKLYGKYYPINKAETDVYIGGWHEILKDQEGEPYFMFGGCVIYFEIEEV